MRTKQREGSACLRGPVGAIPLSGRMRPRTAASLMALTLLATACSSADVAEPPPEPAPETSVPSEPASEVGDAAEPSADRPTPAEPEPEPPSTDEPEATAEPEAPEQAPDEPEGVEPSSTTDQADDGSEDGERQFDTPEGPFIDISTGGAHACGLRVDHSIACWGDDIAAAAVPEGAFATVSAGWSYTCGLRIDSTAVCWSASAGSESEEAFEPDGQFLAVSAGWGLVCGVGTDSALTCWGSDPPGGRFSSVSVGLAHSCGLLVDSSVVCWGDGVIGGTDPPEGRFSSVSVGWSHSCGLLVDSSVVCWGSNHSGETDAPEGRFSSVSVGWSHSCGLLVDSSVVCWGSNHSGETDAPEGRYISISAGGSQTCGLRPDNTVACWGSPVPRVPPGFELSEPEPESASEPEPEPAPEPGPESNDGSQQGGDVRVIAGRAEWSSGYFQASLFKQLLEELGYEVTDPAQLEMGPNRAYTAMAQGDMDYWPNSWYPSHYFWWQFELPDGSLVEDHVTVVGEQLIAGGLRGFLVTKSFADTYGVYTLDDLNRDARALAAFDDADPRPGNGKADIFGCMENWTCDDIIENMIAFSGWDNIVQIRAGYDAMFEQARRRVNNGDPMVLYTWTPSAYITQLRPGESVYWMGMDRILDDSNPANQERGEEHDQRGADGTGVSAAVGPDQCPSAADQPDGKCPTGWIAADILVTANTEFLRANPMARALFEAVKLTVVEVSEANMTQQLGDHPDVVAARWIADNRDRVDQWLAAARAAAASS